MRWNLMLIVSLAAASPVVDLLADEPMVARWDFGAEELTSLTAHGGVLRDQAGPVSPEFPDFAVNNTAAEFDGQGAYFSLSDPGDNSKFDFANGDAVTLEAWVRIGRLRDGHLMYVVGKGRTGAPQFARDNQNWALRVAGSRGVAKVGFLFATAPGSGDSHWHRWTSEVGFDPGTLWHHIAVAYRFGEPASIRGWIDGQPSGGRWDMGGATTKPPVVDNDAVWIGSANGGSPSNSFLGRLDGVAIHRALLDDKAIAGRFHRVGGPRIVGPLPEVMPNLTDVPPGRVVVTLAEGMPAHQRWLNEGESWPAETVRWLGNEFLLPRIPQRYDPWGIRADWNAPLLMRMTADVQLPPGRHRLVLRARALSRLWVDGVVVARTEAITKSPPDGEEPITPVPTPPLPGLRAHGYHQQEVYEDVVIADAVVADAVVAESRPVRVVLETIIGAPNRRTETGEICVAVQRESQPMFTVLPAAGRPEIPLTDDAVEPVLARIESSLSDYDDQTRRRAAASQDEFWSRRHALARDWAQQHPAPAVPYTANLTGERPIDAFVAAKIRRARAATAGASARETRHFHGQVLPILREHCFRCHGEKDSGGLKLNSRELAMKGGDSEVPAVLPGDPRGSEMIARIRETDDDLRMPPTGRGLAPKQIAALETWVESGATWPEPPVKDAEVALAPVVSDEVFLRRIFLDTVGAVPTQTEAEQFLDEVEPGKRDRLIDQLLDDPRCADHSVSFWLDLLAENPTLLNASLNSTGPFRWFLYESLRDHKPLDRMVTELIVMRGSAHEGGSAGFALAAENDAPFAAKGHIVASAFLGIELQCARCHDSPYHETTQRDLYSLAAMLDRRSVTVPSTSRVPDAFFAAKTRESLIRVTLKPGEPVTAQWPFAAATGVEDSADVDPLMLRPADPRERLAALITAPWNQRFARVAVNRIWKRLLGTGIVEPVHDWEGRAASHPKLLEWLAHELVSHDYDVRHVIRLIVSSQTYQREARGHNSDATAPRRFFNAPDPRRMTAEQVVDSIYVATGSAMDVEELTFVHDGQRPMSKRLSLGRPTRAWMFASLNNERDRPSLALPRARAVVDVLEAFGWTGSRQKPIHQRETEANVLQPGVLANSTLSMTLTRAAHGSELAQLAVEAESPEGLVDSLFLRVLSRRPNSSERTAFSTALAEGFFTRLVPAAVRPLPELPELPLVTWFNHLRPQATTIQNEWERRVRMGPPPDSRLNEAWREVYEDIVWSLINHREFVWLP